MILIGISGAINHGKTSLANFLQAASPGATVYESSDIIMEVANQLRDYTPSPKAEDSAAVASWLEVLPQILATVTQTTVSYEALQINPERINAAPDEFAKLIGYLRLMSFQPELLSKPINRANKDEFRILLQWLGGYLAKHVNGQLWYQEIVRRGKTSGCKLIIAGGVRFPADADCLRANEGVIINIVRPDLREVDVTDVTERERATINFDCTIINDGSLEALHQAAEQVYNDIIQGNLQTDYIASKFEPPTTSGLSFS